MWSLAWPWVLLALPLPLLVRYLMPPVIGTQDAGLKVPSFKSFSVLSDRSEVEQLMNWHDFDRLQCLAGHNLPGLGESVSQAQ